MNLTKIKSHFMIHSESPNSEGAVFGGYVIDKAVQVAHLAVQEFIEVCFKSDGEPMKAAADVFHHFSLVNMDTVSFIAPVRVGDILKMEAKVIFADPKKGLVRVRACASTMCAHHGIENKLTNIFHMTYRV